MCLKAHLREIEAGGFVWPFRLRRARAGTERSLERNPTKLRRGLSCGGV